MTRRTTTTAARGTWTFRYAVLATFFVCCALSLAGCKSGTLTGSKQACKSTGGLLADKTITCTGSASVARGEPSLGIIDTDGDLSGNYELDATITTEEGETKANVTTANGGAVSGKVVPGKPLHINAVVGLDEEDEDVPVNLKVLGKKVKNLRYEATVLPQ
jgi:hypothetical protein